MAPDRRLIAPQASDGAAGVRCSANIVGVLPPQIFEILDRDSRRTAASGRVDDCGSGISFLLGRGGSDDFSSISLWEHSTKTLCEDLEPGRLIALLIHPEHRTCDASGDLLVASVGPEDDSRAPPYAKGRGSRGLRTVYAASPASGVLCAWVIDVDSHARGCRSTGEPLSQRCDASVRLRLRPDEVLTSLAPVVGILSSRAGGGEDAAWLLASTSAGRLWKIYKTSRPLTLHAKSIQKKMLGGGGTAGDETEESTGIIKGLYDYFSTPSKARLALHDLDAAMHGRESCSCDHDSASDEDEGIAALVPLPPPSEQNGGVAGSTRILPPRKQPRISSAPPCIVPARALTLTPGLLMKMWQISLLARPEAEVGGSAGVDGGAEGCASRTLLFQRNSDGTLNLSSLHPKATSSLDGYHHADMLCPPSLCRDGRSLIVALRIERKGDADATRAYVVRIGLVDRSGGECSPRILNAAWLDRFSGQSLSPPGIGGSLECAGIVIGDVEEEDMEVATSGIRSVVCYAAFGPRGDGAGLQPPPVTISAIHFPADSTAGVFPRVKDLDLFSFLVPAVVKNSTSYDPLTGGCVFLASSGLLGGVSVRFPSEADVSNEKTVSIADQLLPQHDDAVLTIKSHLQSAFRHYQARARNGRTSGGDPARAIVPPSIMTCRAGVLSAAVVLASRDYVCALPAGGASGVDSPLSNRVAPSPVLWLRDKLRMHGDFINFLVHAGAYRRLSVAGRSQLRDHGEMLVATRALLTKCQEYFSDSEAFTDDAARCEELAQSRQMAMSAIRRAIEGVSNDVTALPSYWAKLQQQQLLPNNDFLIMLTSSSICWAIGEALQYRQDESGPLYDIPSQVSRSTPVPWTSSIEMLNVLFMQLQAIQRGGGSVFSIVIEREKAAMKQYVEDIAASALFGYKDVISRQPELALEDGSVPDNERVLKSYDETKILSISLLRRYADDEKALQVSLAHSHFEGIVEICQDHRNEWRPFCDKGMEQYDLRLMMASNAHSNSPFAHLHRSRDRKSGLTFCTFVLRWYADRGLYPEVFELGRNCPHDLTRYVRSDSRLSNLAWIADLWTGAHEQATSGLLGLTSPLLFGDKKGAMGLWEKEQMTSLAKLSNKLASKKSVNPAAVHTSQRKNLLENELTLISAQKILQADTEHCDNIVLEADLLRLACEKIKSARDMEELRRFGICGLSIASAKPLDQIEAMAEDASSVWYELMLVDKDRWKCIAQENSATIGGLSEERLAACIHGTAFAGVMYDFAETAPSDDSRMRNVSFLSEGLRTRVLHTFGSDELVQVLMDAASMFAGENS